MEQKLIQALVEIRTIGYSSKFEDAAKAVLEMIKVAENVLLEVPPEFTKA